MGSDKRIRDTADFIATTLGIVKLPVELLDRPVRSVFVGGWLRIQWKWSSDATNVAPITGGRCREFPEMEGGGTGYAAGKE